MLHADHEQNCSTSTRCGWSAPARPTSTPRVPRAWGLPLWGCSTAERTWPSSKCSRASTRRHVGGGGPHPGEGQAERVQADGLRAPGVQKLRPQGPDPQARRQGASASSGSRIRCSTWPESSKNSPLIEPYFVEREALPQRRLLRRHHHAGDGHSTAMFYGHVRDRADAPAGSPIGKSSESRPGQPDRVARVVYVGPTKQDYTPWISVDFLEPRQATTAAMLPLSIERP